LAEYLQHLQIYKSLNIKFSAHSTWIIKDMLLAFQRTCFLHYNQFLGIQIYGTILPLNAGKWSLLKILSAKRAVHRSPVIGSIYLMIDWDLNPRKIPKFLSGPIVAADVVTWVHKQLTQTYANGKYLVNFHVPIVKGT
jgi:hypothetical protein